MARLDQSVFLRVAARANFLQATRSDITRDDEVRCFRHPGFPALREGLHPEVLGILLPLVDPLIGRQLGEFFV